MTIAATHRDEVQTITTAAPAIVGVQLMTTSADEGTTVAGNFALQFPEIQTVTLSATAEVTAGKFKLTYTSGLTPAVVYSTDCLGWNAEAQDVSGTDKLLSLPSFGRRPCPVGNLVLLLLPAGSVVGMKSLLWGKIAALSSVGSMPTGSIVGVKSLLWGRLSFLL